MMIFGRSLFGGATSGQILATGFAAVLATAVAVPEVTRLGYSNAQASASVQVQGLKNLIPETYAVGSAKALGAAHVTFVGYVHSIGAANARAASQVAFFLSGHADGRFVCKALAFKRTRIHLALMRAYAYGEADGQNYQFATALTARGTARGFGTTYYVGRINAQPTASAEGVAFTKAGAAVKAQATAEASGECHRTAGAGTATRATAKVQVDAAVTRAGVRYFELFGDAQAKGMASLSHTLVYQIQSVYSEARASTPKGVHIKGAKGRALTTSKARGIGLGTVTAVAAFPGNSKTIATGNAQYRAGLKGFAVAGPTTRAEASGFYNKAGTAIASPHLAIKTLVLSIRGAIAQSTAQGVADATRIVQASAQVLAGAYAEGFIQVNDLSKAPASRTVLLIEEDRLVLVEAQPRLILI